MAQSKLLKDIEAIAHFDNRDEYLMETARVIQRHYSIYNWVGYYFLKGDKLHVGPYIGKPTPHTVIDLHQGICGAAVSRKATIVVDDVNADPRYLSCSLETKSEIVIPLTVKDTIIGELDIDSSVPAAFSKEDKELLERAVSIIGRVLETY